MPYLVDQRGDPLLMVDDAAWSIFVSPTKEETVRYLDDRQHRAFRDISGLVWSRGRHVRPTHPMFDSNESAHPVAWNFVDTPLDPRGGS